MGRGTSRSVGPWISYSIDIRDLLERQDKKNSPLKLCCQIAAQKKVSHTPKVNTKRFMSSFVNWLTFKNELAPCNCIRFLLIIVSIWSITYHFLLCLHKGVSKNSFCFSFSIIYSFLLIDLSPKQWPTWKPKLLWSLFTIYVSCCSSFFPVLLL